MDKLIIHGSVPLSGEVIPAGNKNAALPLISACTLTEEPVILHNIPQIRDVLAMRALLESLGVQIEALNSHSWRIQAKDIRPADLDPDLCRQIRASLLLAGPMIARSGTLELPPPGGDVIGRRRVDTHILAFKALGANADFNRANNIFRFSASGLKGANILLDEASVTATEKRHHGGCHSHRYDRHPQCRF
jgi:UDP-N-acetylglucosamine 1-carboxyvinyltransferase